MEAVLYNPKPILGMYGPAHLAKVSLFLIAILLASLKISQNLLLILL